MSLTLRMEELSRFRVSADLGSNDCQISVALKPEEDTSSAPTFETGVLIHFETVVENGCSKLDVFTSFEEEGKVMTRSSPAASSAAASSNHVSNELGE